MKFEEICEMREQDRISIEEAATLLGMSERNLRRYVKRYEEEGIDGLADKRLGKAAHNCAPVDEVIALSELYSTKYREYNCLHFYEKYRDYHAGSRSYSWVKKTLQELELVPINKKRGPHRCKRPRRPMKGMMLHQDASTHLWVPGHYWDLVVTMDDADSEIYSAFFVEQEGTWSSLRGVAEVIETHGLFCSFYSDRGSHYWTTPKEGGKVDKHNLTQFGRALKQLNIEMIAAYSPEARGRSERMFRTLQGRLPQELKSAGITEMSDANQFLKDTFIPELNRRLKVKPQETESAFVRFDKNVININEVLCLHEQRTVNKDNTISYKGKKWQIPKDPIRYSYAKAKVEVREYKDGSVSIFHGPRELVRFNAEPPEPMRKPQKEMMLFGQPLTVWTTPSDQPAPYGSYGKVDGQHVVLPTTFPQSQVCRPQGTEAQQQVV